MASGPHLLLGVCGGIACYKVADLASKLVRRGATVDVIMTEAATRFVTPLTFESLTHRAVHRTMWDRHDLEPHHIALAERPAAVILAPASANTLAKLAHGLADNLLSTVLLACKAPLLIAPAMNDEMYAHPATQANLALLRERGATFVGPEAGRLASGKAGGPGRMSEPAAILAALDTLLDESV